MANTQLLLQEARTVLTETGWSRHHDAGEPHGLRRALAQGRLVAEGLYHDEVAGCLLASPSPDLDDTTDGDWRPVGAHWCPLAAQPSPFWRADGSSALAMAWRDQGAWSLESLAHAGWGEPRYVRWITYQTPGAPADQGLTLTFGGVWRLRLRGDGQRHGLGRVGPLRLDAHAPVRPGGPLAVGLRGRAEAGGARSRP